MSPLCDNDEIGRRYKTIVCDENHDAVVQLVVTWKNRSYLLKQRGVPTLQEAFAVDRLYCGYSFEI